MTRAQETETPEIKAASHCLNLKPNLSFMAQTERGGESDTSVWWRGGGVRNPKGREGGGEREVCTVSLLLLEHQELLMWDDVTGLHSVACAFVTTKTENQ